MNAIGMEDKEGGVTQNWIFTNMTGVVELHFEADFFQRDLNKFRACPFLKNVSVKKHSKNENLMHLDTM